MDICKLCLLFKDGYCSTSKQAPVVTDFEYKGELRKQGQIVNGCGCMLSAKVRSNSKCPIGNF